MSAKTDRPRDRHGLALIDRTSTDNVDSKKRWSRRWRYFCHIKQEVEPQRQQLLAVRGSIWRRPEL